MHIGHGHFFQNLDDRPDYDVWSTEMVLADRAEALGFESVWAVEHHFCGYFMSTDPLQFSPGSRPALIASSSGRDARRGDRADPRNRAAHRRRWPHRCVGVWHLAREVVLANQARFARSVMPALSETVAHRI
jgi:hypothetical protein